MQRGNVAAARVVYCNALQAAQALAQDASKDDAKELWASWAALEYEAGEVERCRAVLAAFVAGSSDLGEFDVFSRIL